MNLIPNMLLTPDDTAGVALVVSVRIGDRGTYAVAEGEGEIAYDGRPAATLLAEVFDELATTLRASVEDRP